jgi:hypothetical protein
VDAAKEVDPQQFSKPRRTRRSRVGQVVSVRIEFEIVIHATAGIPDHLYDGYLRPASLDPRAKPAQTTAGNKYDQKQRPQAELKPAAITTTGGRW